MIPSKITYTRTDEAPFFASISLLPIFRFFLKQAHIKIEIKDISLAGRILAQFPDDLKSHQRINDDLKDLGKMVKTSTAHIIKLPNISASIPQLKQTIKELQEQGYNVPDYPVEDTTKQDKQVRQKYAKVLGSAVNPILRQGNSDRRVAPVVKQHARQNPHSMAPWSTHCKTHIAHMEEGDFYGNEKALEIQEDTEYFIEIEKPDGNTEILKEKAPLLKGEIIDASYMNIEKLRSFLKKEIQKAKQENLLLSLHLKCTMMKVSDPIFFGEMVKIYFEKVLKNHSQLLSQINFNPKNGIEELDQKIQKYLSKDQITQIQNSLQECHQHQAQLAMTDSTQGYTHLHRPNDVIIDASMPALIRKGGKLWGPDGQLHETKALIPDRSYAKIYQQVIEFCKTNGSFDVSTMGHVSNVGLMAQKAQEYGSHDKTFQIQTDGIVRVKDIHQHVLLEHKVHSGDVWRMCQTKAEAIKDWIQLAVKRAKTTNTPAFFWLDPQRPQDQILIKKVKQYIKNQDLESSLIQIFSPLQAIQHTLERLQKGKDTISVTGNVLRDYLTDLFPILELGTSSKMLSIVPLLSGGSLFETGAGGTAPRHVDQLLQENHLRWDSLGEFLALSVCLEDIANKTHNDAAKILAQTLDKANENYLKNNKSPSRKIKELDTRGSHFYFTLYWTEALTKQEKNLSLKEFFKTFFHKLKQNEHSILSELTQIQGYSVDVGGYYHPNENKTLKIMRPSKSFNQIL